MMERKNVNKRYCRKSIREYLHFLNITLATSGESHSCIYSFRKANQLTMSHHSIHPVFQHFIPCSRFSN